MANLENRFANQRDNPLMLLKNNTEMADRAGFEPAVAVTPRTLSKRVP